MILTKKGSTRGTVSVLLMSTLIVLAVRLIVAYLEEMLPPVMPSTINWHRVSDVLEKQDDDEVTSKLENDGNSADRRKSDDTLAANMQKMFPDNTGARPLLIFITDKNSWLCKTMETRALSGNEITTLIDKYFYPVKMCTDKPMSRTELKIFHDHAMTGLPEIIILSPEGEKLNSSYGYLSSDKVCILLHQALKTIEKKK